MLKPFLNAVRVPEARRILHPDQRRVLACKAKLRTCCSGRRSGKTYAFMVWLTEQWASRPGQVSLFVATTTDQAMWIGWETFRALNERFKWGFVPNIGDKAWYAPNGFALRFAGAKDRNEANRLRGVPKLHRITLDECFVGSTVVRPIGRVLATMSRPAPDRLIEIDGVVSTPNHPYITPDGWKRAEDVRPGDLLCVWEAEDIPDGGEPAATVCHPEVRDVLAGVSLQGCIQDLDAHQAAAAFVASEETWPAPVSEMQRTGEGGATCGWASTEDARRQRPWAYAAATASSRCHWLADGSERCSGGRRAPASLPVGSGRRIDEIGCGGRRGEPSSGGPQGSGFPEGPAARWRRVDRVEVHERDGAGRYREVCPDGLVYNLQTESGLYFAGGALVHNCGVWNDGLLKYTWEACLRPTLMDTGGDGALIGTPNETGVGFYEDMMLRCDAAGNHFVWNATSNPHLAKPGDESLAEVLAEDFSGDGTNTTYRREYLGERIKAAGILIYEHGQEIWDPNPPSSRNYTAMGVDIGWHDGFGFTVVRARDPLPGVYVLEAHAESYITPDRAAAIIERMRSEWRVNEIFIDTAGGGGATICGAFAEQYGLPAVPVKKAGIRMQIEQVRSLLASQTLKASREKASMLGDEFRNLPWDEDHKKHREGFADECVNALQYALTGSGFQHRTSWQNEPSEDELREREERAAMARAMRRRGRH